MAARAPLPNQLILNQLNPNQSSDKLNNVLVHINHILMSNDNPSIIYFAVGSAAQTFEIIDGKRVIKQENYQQFPNFLQKMYLFERMNVFIVLIDPELESPPYIITDKNFDAILGIKEWKHTPEFDVYEKSNVYVYSIRRFVKTSVDELMFDADDITENLQSFNELAKSENVFMFYYNYSGIDVCPLAKLFDEQNKEYLSQIIYGFGGRINHGCYLDLTSNDAQFAFKVVEKVKRRCIEVFNVNAYYYNQIDIHNIMREFDETNLDIIIHHIEIFKREFVSSFITRDIYIMRNIINIIKKINEKDEQTQLSDILFLNIQKSMFTEDEKKVIYELFDEIHFNQVVRIIKDIYANYLDKYQTILQISQKGKLMTGEEIINYIMDDADPYRWIDRFKNLMK
jgi:hypothetical protein